MSIRLFSKTSAMSVLLAAAVALAAPLPAMAQAKTKFCAVLEKVQKDAKNAFANLGKVDKKKQYFETEPLETPLPGSVCRLTKLYDLVSYECEIPGPSEAKAVAAKNYFSGQILACYPLVKLLRYGKPPTPVSPVKFSLPLADATVGVNGKKGNQNGYISISAPD